MTTPFSEVYDLFLSNVESYSLFQILQEDEEAFKAECRNWLMQAIVAYPTAKSNILEFDVLTDSFNMSLAINEKVVLAKLMVVEYLNPFVISEIHWRQTLNSKDYRSYAPNKHIESLQKIKRDLQREVEELIIKQSYSLENLKSAFGKKNERL